MRGPGLSVLALCLLLAAGTAAGHGEAPEPNGGAGAPRTPAPLYEPPEPGSYELPVIRRVTSHVLLDESGAEAALPDVPEGEVALVAFVYTRCTDAHGCPLSLASLQRLDRMLAHRPDLGSRTRLVTVSFDPRHDTPQTMRRLRESLAPRGRWDFLTAPDVASLGPVLRDYGQDAARDAGDPEGPIRHVLKVFLVDSGGAVRNVYSAGFLDPRLLLNDVATLLHEG